MEIGALYKEACATLFKKFQNKEEASLEAYVLVSFVAKKDKSFILTYPEYQVSDDEIELVKKYVMMRIDGTPIAYITGEREFWSMNLKVTKDTLIPRPDTETLVEQALRKRNNIDVKDNKLRILDMGTGTGAIALALKSEFKSAHVDAIDYSEAALKVAKGNAKNLHLDVNFMYSDWYDSLKEQHQYHLIVSNPPYICEGDPHLSIGDVRFEPMSALVAPMQGLRDILIIIRDASKFLCDGGYLLIEHGYRQGSDVRSLMMSAGFVEVETCRDLGNNERVTLGRYIK